VLTVALVFTLLATISMPLFGRPFLTVGSPLGHPSKKNSHRTASTAHWRRRSGPMSWPARMLDALAVGKQDGFRG